MNSNKILFLVLVFLLMGCTTSQPYFGAFESKNHVIVGAYQVSVDDFMNFRYAVDDEVKPIVYKDYFDKYDPNLNLYYHIHERETKN